MNANGIVRREGGHIEFLAEVEGVTAERLLCELYEALNENAEWIMVSICSNGGNGHIAFQLYSRIWKLMRINEKRLGTRIPLWTCALGDVASAGVVLFMAGEKRYITRDATLRFHEPTISFSAAERGIPVQAVRASVEAIDKKTSCHCEDGNARMLIKHLVDVGGRSADRWHPYMRSLSKVAELTEKGMHCCEHGPIVVRFLQELVNYADRSSRAYAAIIARRAGMPVEQVLELMKRSSQIDGIRACILGLAHECV